MTIGGLPLSGGREDRVGSAPYICMTEDRLLYLQLWHLRQGWQKPLIWAFGEVNSFRESRGHSESTVHRNFRPGEGEIMALVDILLSFTQRMFDFTSFILWMTSWDPPWIAGSISALNYLRVKRWMILSMLMQLLFLVAMWGPQNTLCPALRSKRLSMICSSDPSGAWCLYSIDRSMYLSCKSISTNLC